DPVGLMKAAGGDAAKAAQSAGLIDRIGTRADFGARVAAIAGADGASKRPGAYAHTGLAAYLARHPESRAGKAIGVVTVAGDIVDGNEGPGTAGGARIARLIDDSAAKNLAALVVRVDSPGGSVTGAEAIRAAILRAKARGLPVVVSMGDMAASGGYWVATPGSRIYARPGTITGSIGIFAVIPSFEKALAAWGVSGDGVRTTPLSGQPDVFTGLTPQMEQLVQAEIEGGYARFVGLVAASRHKSPEAVDAIAQGRVWDGASARGNGLIDAYGGLDEALADAASQAHLGAGAWHADYLGSEKSAFAQWLAQIAPDDGTSDSGDGDAPQDLAGLVADRQQRELAGMLGDVAMLAGSKGAKAYCLECSAALLAPRPLPAGGWPGWLGLAGQVLAAFRR
ncbi:MAG TPA: S49 family peptidase, partial [Novosphingobium sp.]|nr:S49 family peptidase [Novosphingobium sp.]